MGGHYDRVAAVRECARVKLMKKITGGTVRRLYGSTCRTVVEKHFLRSRFALVRRATNWLATFANRVAWPEAASDADHLERLLESGRRMAGSSRSRSSSLPKISIVTPNFNQGRFLAGCFESIISQGYPNLELIVLDGGSTDESVEVIRHYESYLTFWVSEKDGGQAAAINSGLARSTGEIFNWINADDRLAPGALMRCAQTYIENPSAAGWVGGCVRIEENGAIADVIYPNGAARDNVGENWNGRQFYQPSCFLSAEILKAIDGLDASLFIALDVDLWLRALEHGEFVIGEGIWSLAINHEDAKTQNSLERMFLETAQIQERYGFIAGARTRRRGLQRLPLTYTLPAPLAAEAARLELSGLRMGPTDSRNVCISGDFHSYEDRATATYFVDMILPSILRRRWLEVHLLGPGAASVAKSFALANVRGHDSDSLASSVLSEYRLLVSPRQFRCGVTTGVDEAARWGIPVVSTTFGLGKLPLVDGLHCFIADVAVEFAEKCNQLLHDPISWTNFSVRAQLLAAQRSPVAGGAYVE